MLRAAHDRSVDAFARLEEEDDFSIIIDAPPIRAKTGVKCKPIRPEFTAFRVADIFWRLVSGRRAREPGAGLLCAIYYLLNALQLA